MTANLCQEEILFLLKRSLFSGKVKAIIAHNSMQNQPTPIARKFTGKDILSLSQFDKKSIEKLFSYVPQMAEIGKNAKTSELLRGKIVTLLFYEPSSRTFGSFSASIKQLGGQTIEIINPQQFSSVSKGETFEDTIRVFEAYCDAIVLRHPEIGSAQKAADVARFVPIINAGDGVGEHPTQALFDLYTIFEKTKSLENVTGVLVGDMLNGRTVHSLIQGLSLYKGNTLYLLSPRQLRLKKEDMKKFSEKGIQLIEIDREGEIPKGADFWYWTRVQKERFKKVADYEKVKNKFILTPHLIEKYAGKKTIFMHPLPRVGEIEMKVDQDPRAVYLTSQIRNGMYLRMALISLVLGEL